MTDQNIKDLSRALGDCFVSPNVFDSNGEPANIVDAIDTMGRALSHQIQYLGNGDAYSAGMGAIEWHAMKIEAAGDKIAEALHEVAEAISSLAESIKGE